MKELKVLIGLPCSGKTTYIKSYLDRGSIKVLSRDDVVDAIAKKYNMTYDEVFHDHCKQIDSEYKLRVDDAIKYQPDMLVMDKTNLYSHVRDREVKPFFDAGYVITYIFFEKPVEDDEIDEWKRRLQSRHGKTIPQHVQKRMYENYMEDVPLNAAIQPHYKFWINTWKAQ